MADPKGVVFYSFHVYKGPSLQLQPTPVMDERSEWGMPWLTSKDEKRKGSEVDVSIFHADKGSFRCACPPESGMRANAFTY